LQVLNSLPAGNVKIENYKIVSPSRLQIKTLMESLIHHFKFYSNGTIVKKGEVYISVEAPKGEFGIYLVSNNKEVPYRCKIRPPGFMHLQAINYFSKGHLIADIVTIIGTLDIVFGEIDR
jgi:NADH-quinone oxidoreductase subunit D